jgi:hypothetical protein
MNKDEINFSKYATSIKKINSKILFALLVTFILVATTAPIVLAATEDTVIITFDPDGNIDIDISYSSYNFSSVSTNTWANTSAGYFTLYNNGSVPMDTEIKTNASTDEGNMNLNASGVPPGTDEYAIYIDNNLDFPGYLTTAYGTYFDQGLASSDSKTFDICLLIGVNLTANFSWQTTTIYFQGSIS